MSAILHPDKIPFSISDLTTTDIDSLTHILSQPLWVPNSDSSPLGTRQLWDRQKAISKLIQDLPFHLRRPIPSQTRIVSFISRKCNDDIPPACHLCDAHSRLNAQLIQTILSRIQIEVGERLNTFAKNMSKLSPEYKDLVCELRALHALWIPPDVYRKTYLSEPHTKWTFQPDECGACILARIGEDKHTLMLLRMTILARQKRRLPEPRLLRWVDGWIDWTGAAEEIRKESNEKEKELGKTRRVFHKRVKPSGFEKNVDEVPPKKKAGVEKEGRKESSSPLSEDYGFEEDIINGYQPSYSRYSSASPTGDEETERLLTGDEDRDRSSASSSNAHARMYQDLVGDLGSSRNSSRLSIQTRWSNMI